VRACDQLHSVYLDYFEVFFFLSSPPVLWWFVVEKKNSPVYLQERDREVRRIEACVYHWNPASAKVLEKNGFRFEERIKASSVRLGEVADNLVYAKLLNNTAG